MNLIDKKIFIKTFGCRVNQVESQSIRELFVRAGATFTDKFEGADICLLNTCTVTAKADSDVEKLMRQINTRNPAARLILTGCYASAHQDKIEAAFPHAEIVDKYDLGRKIFNTDDMCWTVSGNEGKNRAFIKIQDGCDAFCSYCIVPYARSKKISKPLKETLAEIKQVINAGYKEIVLTGINIGNYLCPQTKADLAKLLEEIFNIDAEFRIRFSSIEPLNITPRLISVAKAGGEKFCDYFHIPLQSGSDGVLKAMNRRYSTLEYSKSVFDLRKEFENIGVYADVIAGFPTETEDDFEETYNFIKRLGLSGLHVFSYSPRPLTKAAAMPQLDAKIITARAQKLRMLDQELRNNFAAAQTGKTLQILVENIKNGQNSGVAGNFVRVNFKGNSAAGSLKKIKIISCNENICEG